MYVAATAALFNHTAPKCRSSIPQTLIILRIRASCSLLFSRLQPYFFSCPHACTYKQFMLAHRPSHIEYKRLSVSLYFIYFDWSHSILIPPACLVSHLFLCVFFFHYLPSALPSLVSFSSSTERNKWTNVYPWPFLCKISLHLDPQFLMGVHQKERARARNNGIYWRKSFWRSQKRLEKTTESVRAKQFMRICICMNRTEMSMKHFNGLLWRTKQLIVEDKLVI